MKPTIKKPATWSAIRQQIATWEKPALLALLKDLYETNTKNRDFLLARCQAEAGGGDAIESYRKKIVDQFFPPGASENSSSARRARPSATTTRQAAAFRARPNY